MKNDSDKICLNCAYFDKTSDYCMKYAVFPNPDEVYFHAECFSETVEKEDRK